MAKTNPDDEKSDPNGHKSFVTGPLAGRVYNDGRVQIGVLVIDSVTPGKPRLEVEVTVNTQTAREFLERMIGLVNQADGRYS